MSAFESTLNSSIVSYRIVMTAIFQSVMFMHVLTLRE